MADWARHRVALAFIPPGEPWRNGYVESFNSRVRDECLDINIFWSLVQARVVISDWKEEFNHHRRHSAQDVDAATRVGGPHEGRGRGGSGEVGMNELDLPAVGEFLRPQRPQPAPRPDRSLTPEELTGVTTRNRCQKTPGR
jgi:hypothetical protein